jgi:TPR repeat protein
MLAVQEERLEDAASLLRHLTQQGGLAIRPDARRALGSVAANLGYRAYVGEGGPRDAAAALRWFLEACGAGDDRSCDVAERITASGQAPGDP